MEIQKRRVLQGCLGAGSGLFSAFLNSTAMATTSTNNAKIQSDQKRQARDRPYDLSTGELGNLRRLTLRMEDTAVLVSRGNKNMLLRGNQKVRITNEGLTKADSTLPYSPRDLVLDTPFPSEQKNPWIHIQVETLEELYIAGRGLFVLLAQLELPLLDLSMHSQTVAIQNIEAKELRININGQGTLIASGRSETVSFESSQQGSVIFAQGLTASSIDVRPTSRGQLYAINISPITKASYYNPASTPSNTADLYPIEIIGEPARLKFTGPGRAKVSALSRVSIEKTKATNSAIQSRLQIALANRPSDRKI